MRITAEEVAELAAKATPGWRKRTHRGLPSFIESPRSGRMGYALEVFGEDYTGYGDDEQRERDLDFAAAAHDMAVLIAQQAARIEELEKDAVVGRALNRAAEILPDGFIVAVEVERGCGTVTLHGDEFEPVDFDDSDDLFADRIQSAIDAAIRQQSEGGEV